jgi:WXG100 family type VII secretion target
MERIVAMTQRFMTDPAEMRAMAAKFDAAAQSVSDEARKMFASSLNIVGAGWGGDAANASHTNMGEANQAFNHIVTSLQETRDGMIRDANNFEQQEHESQRLLRGGQ